MKKIFISLIAFVIICINLNAQEKSKKEQNGDKYFFVYSYVKAIDSYTQVKHLKADGQRKLAICYHKTGKNAESEDAYATLLNMPDGNSPDDYFNYAMILKMNGKYDDALKSMETFKKLKPDDLRARNFIVNKDKLEDLSIDKGKYNIVHLDINTDAEDFGTSFYKNKIVFASTKTSAKYFISKYNWTGKPYWDMYVADIDKKQLTSPVIFDKKLNGKLNDGPASFSNDGNFMAFNRNNYDTKRRNMFVRLQICFSSFKDGKWSEPEPFYLNSNDYSVGHPCLTADGKTMYFVSDMPGGFGGTDIYRITKDDKGVWGKPENLGEKINTEGDEMFPYIEEKNGILFFSSNGRYGLGGLDIYFCAISGLRFGRVYNAGAPLNSKDDDFAVIVNDSVTHGYFSSNRTGGSGGDDMYYFDFLKTIDVGKKITGIVKDKNDVPIPNSYVILYDDKNNIVDTTATQQDAAFTFLVDADKNFKLMGIKKTYNEGYTNTNTFGPAFIVKADVVLLQNEIVALSLPPLAFNNIYFDLDKYNIRPDAIIELSKMVSEMNKNPAMIVKVSAYTDCRESKKYNQILSDKRALATVMFIRNRITNPQRIYGEGYSKTNLVNACACDGAVVSNCPESDHQKNRRTEFVIISN